jgi:hypothetical protein
MLTIAEPNSYDIMIPYQLFAAPARQIQVPKTALDRGRPAGPNLRRKRAYSDSMLLTAPST